ncbi:MAG: phosphomannomutase [Methylotenera sp.]|nr:MAG: phosphomannomutase [Methylotenera sp.]
MDATGVRFGTSGVRGLVSEITPEVCFAYVQAFLQVASHGAHGTVAIAMDLRPSSPQIVRACMAALHSAGLKVDFCGSIPTPALAYYAQMHGILGIMVTGSHIPFDRNGIKFYATHGEITKQEEAAIANAIVSVPEEIALPMLPKVSSTAAQTYINRYLNFFTPDILLGMKLGFYEHSSVARDLLCTLLEALGAEVISLGRTEEFVPIDTEAVSEADTKQARLWANEFGFDAIISTDGDADRPLVGDELGNWLRGDIVCTLCARYLEAETVVAPVSCNTAIELSGAFNKVIRTKIGSPYVIEGIQRALAAGSSTVVGFEANGGLILGSAIRKNDKALAELMTRDAVLPILVLLVLAKTKRCKLSELLHDLPKRFTASDRLQLFSQEASRLVLAKLASSIEAARSFFGDLGLLPTSINQTDGLRVLMENGEIVHFRQSGNAPELRCYAEADEQDRANWLVKESLRLIALNKS